ncbi:MAG: FxsA family protein, partial [Thermoanaerobaculales bacterium]|nr:FxsA family protein [Thermoanaerobaculales bacterium]
RNSKSEIRNSFRLLYALLMFLRLLLLFTIVPLIELYLLIKIGGVIGVVPTIAIVIGTGVLGAWLARWQGLAVLRRISDEMAAGRLPTDALIDGLLILVAAAVLLTPGLLTDSLGFVLLVPASRALVRKVVAAAIAKRVPESRPDVIDAEWFRED